MGAGPSGWLKVACEYRGAAPFADKVHALLLSLSTCPDTISQQNHSYTPLTEKIYSGTVWGYSYSRLLDEVEALHRGGWQSHEMDV
jgi:hypothetical protein